MTDMSGMMAMGWWASLQGVVVLAMTAGLVSAVAALLRARVRQEDPVSILKIRYAKGEISADEFQLARSVLKE